MRGLLLRVILLLLLFALPAATDPGEDPDLGAVVERIERECLRAYPAALLRPMTHDESGIPAEVDAEPAQQFEFLQRDVHLEKGNFYPSTLGDILPVLQQRLRPGIRFLDLGSGDGRVVFLASVLGARATGIEYEESLVSVSGRALQAMDDLLDPERIEIFQGDFFDFPWDGYDAIYYFNDGSYDEERIREKLLREMKPDAVLILYKERGVVDGLALEERVGHVSVFHRADPPPAAEAGPR